MAGIRKKLCGDPVAEALRSIGRRRGDRDPVPWDFTPKERFRMFRHLMHGHAYPASELIEWDGRVTYSWVHSVWTWRHGGRRRFIKEVKGCARAELAVADYEAYDLVPIRCLIGDDGPRFRRMLVAEDAAMMEQRLNGMEADLLMMERKLDRMYGGEIRYRIALYDHSYEAVIRGGKGGWIWTMLMP